MTTYEYEEDDPYSYTLTITNNGISHCRALIFDYSKIGYTMTYEEDDVYRYGIFVNIDDYVQYPYLDMGTYKQNDEDELEYNKITNYERCVRFGVHTIRRNIDQRSIEPDGNIIFIYPPSRMSTYYADGIVE